MAFILTGCLLVSDCAGAVAGTLAAVGVISSVLIGALDRNLHLRLLKLV